MIIQAVSEVASQMVALTGSFQAEGVSNVCAAPPDGVAAYAEEILGWVKYGVIVIIIGTGFASVGAMIVGKLSSNGRAAQVGSGGLFWSVLGAIAFVVIYGVLNGIVGNGC